MFHPVLVSLCFSIYLTFHSIPSSSSLGVSCYDLHLTASSEFSSFNIQRECCRLCCPIRRRRQDITGVPIDQLLKFDQHVQNVCKSANYHIRALKHTHSTLFSDMVRTIASALVDSRLKYANSVLYGTSDANISRLQRVQTIERTCTCGNVHETCWTHSAIHWLQINYCIEYKVATPAFKIWWTGSPASLLPAVSNYIPTRHLRSSSQLLLAEPAVRTETARRSFNQAACALCLE